MTSHTDAIDERDVANLAATRDLYSRADPMPSGLVDRLKFAISVHALHAEVAELMEEAFVVTRAPEAEAPTETESVTFSSPSVSLMVSFSPSSEPGVVRLDGWVTRGGAEVDVVQGSETRTVTADEHGRFVLEGLAKGPVHFVIRASSGVTQARPVITPTIEL
jgi:hypothetical protein